MADSKRGCHARSTQKDPGWTWKMGAMAGGQAVWDTGGPKAYVPMFGGKEQSMDVAFDRCTHRIPYDATAGWDLSGGVRSPLGNLLADKAAAGFCFGIEQADFQGMKLHGRLFDWQGRSIAKFPVGQVERIADDRKAGLPEMDSDLVGSASPWDRFQQRGSVAAAMKDLKGSECLVGWL